MDGTPDGSALWVTRSTRRPQKVLKIELYAKVRLRRRWPIVPNQDIHIARIGCRVPRERTKQGKFGDTKALCERRLVRSKYVEDFVAVHLNLPSSFIESSLLHREPPAKGLLTLPGRPSRKESFNTDILVQVRPVDTLSPTNEPPIAPLFFSGMYQSGIPGQWDSDSPAISKLYGQRILREGNLTCVRYPNLNR